MLHEYINCKCLFVNCIYLIIQLVFDWLHWTIYKKVSNLNQINNFQLEKVFEYLSKILFPEKLLKQ